LCCNLPSELRQNKKDESLWETHKPLGAQQDDLCQAFNTSCDRSSDELCAGGKGCADVDVSKSFESELAALEYLSVTRISISVGSSDIQRGHGVDLIDNNPNKERFDLLPRQV
jgi:hypothetical protein